MPAAVEAASLAGALAGLRVLEASAGLAGEHCGYALAELGARVTAFRASQDAEVHPLDHAKTVVRLDPRETAGFEALVALAREADCFIEDRPAAGWLPGGALADRLVAAVPHLVAVCLSPFGRSGPHADWAGHPLNVYHGGGNAQQIPCDALRPDFRARPPLQAGGAWGEANAGTLAAIAAIACLRDRRAFAGTIIDCAKQEALISYNWTEAARFPNEHRSPSRLAPLATIVGGIQPAADGHVQIAVREDHQWAGLARLLDRPEWIDDPRYATRAARISRWEEVARMIAEETARRPAADLHRRGRALGIPIAAVLDVAGLLADADLAARGAWRDAAPLRMPRWDTSVTAASAAPAGKAARPAPQPSRPLAGVRVLDFGWVAMGPYAGYVLACLGAEVIHVARPVAAIGAGVDLGAYNYGFDTLNTGKTWVGIDLARAEGRALVHSLVRDCDVVLENFRPGVAARLGIDYPTLAAINPRLVMLSASTYGERAIEGAFVGYAPVFAALGGLAHLTGHSDGPPSEVSHPVDFYAGSVGVMGLMAAMHRRDATGRGTHIDLAAREAILWSLGDAIARVQLGLASDARRGNGHPAMAPHGAYPCRGENRWISIAVSNDAEWRSLAAILALPVDPRFDTAAGRLANVAALDALLQSATAGEDPWPLCERLQAAGVAAFPTVASEDLWNDAHLRSRGVYRARDAAGTARWYVCAPWRYGDAPRPALETVEGQAAADAVFGDLLGLDAAAIGALLERGVISIR